MDEKAPPLPEKDFFSMGEACRIAQIPDYTLRYWEEQFGALRPSRRAGGHRKYTKADLETIFTIKDLLHRKKMTVEGARRALTRRARGEQSGDAPEVAGDSSALKLLREVKKEIKDLVAELAR
jgi:DNA-binding transcriptional MerR regulator